MAKKPNETVQGTEDHRDKAVQEQLERLRNEYEALHKKKIETDTTLKSLEKQLRQLKAEAEAAYGTSDLDELTALLETRRRENEQMVKDYQEHIRSIKTELEKIEGDEEPTA